MQSIGTPLSQARPPSSLLRSRAHLHVGRALSALAILFLAFDAASKLLLVPQVVQGSAELGFSANVVFALGVVLLACVVLYAVPVTSVLGAVLLVGYLGGAVATHVRMGDPPFTHVLFPVYVGLFVWGGLFLRDTRVRAVLPFTRQSHRPGPNADQSRPTEAP